MDVLFLLIAFIQQGCFLYTCPKQDIWLKWPEKNFQSCETTTVSWMKNGVVIMETISINGSIGFMKAIGHYGKTFYVLNLHKVLLQNVSLSDEGNYSYKANCDNKQTFESEKISLHVFSAVKKSFIEKTINIYESKSLEISLPYSPYCYVINVLWHKNGETFAFNFLDSRPPIYTSNPHMNDIVFITPYKLRFNDINMLHNGSYLVSIDYRDGTKLTHKISIRVKRIGEIVYKNPLKSFTERQCIGKRVIFPWKLSEPLKDAISESISLNLSLKLFNHKDVLNTSATPTIILNEEYNSLDFENIISSDNFDLSDIFLPYYDLDFLNDEHLGLYTLYMSLRFKKETLHNEKSVEVLWSEDSGPRETTHTTKNAVKDEGDKYETLAIKPAFFILSASHVEKLNDSLEVEYIGPFPLESQMLCDYLTQNKLCSVLQTTVPFEHITMHLNFYITLLPCQYFIDSLFFMQIFFNGSLITESSFKLGKMRRPLTIPSLDWTLNITKVVITPITTAGLSDDEDFSDEVFMKHYTEEISNVLYEAKIYFKEGITAQDFSGLFEIFMKLKKAEEKHQAFCSELKYHVFTTDSMLSQRSQIQPYLEENLRICFAKENENECIQKNEAELQEVVKISLTTPFILLKPLTLFSWSAKKTYIQEKLISLPCVLEVCERSLNLSVVDKEIRETVGDEVVSQKWELSLQVKVNFHSLEDKFVLSRDFIYLMT